MYGSGTNIALLWNSLGNVGIGTTSPGAKLHVVGNQIVSGVVTASAFVGSAGGLTIGTTQLVVTSSGKVGIGTTAPDNMLTVGGNVNQQGLSLITAAGDPFIRFEDYNGGSIVQKGDIYWSRANSALAFNSGGEAASFVGSVGIGTFAPNAKLHVDGNQIVSGVVTASAFVGSGAGLSGITVTNTVITNMVNKTGDTMYGALSLPANGLTVGTTQLVVGSGGAVGIGMSAPVAQLDVRGPSSVVGGISLGDYNAITSRYIGIINPTQPSNIGVNSGFSGVEFGGPTAGGSGVLSGYLAFHTHSLGGSSGDRMRIDKNGNVGIGTNAPGARLHVATGASGVAPLGGSVAAFESGSHTYIGLLSPAASESGLLFANTNNNADGGVIYNSGTTTRGLQFRTSNNAVRMVITSTGNVGIGTETPTNKLHVAGVVQATAYVTGSDRASKENIQPVSVQDILAKVAGLPMATWSFKDDKSGRHLGPMAQDFNEAFGLGNTDTGIFTVDADGVALAAIQALNQKLEQKDARLDALQKQNEELRRQLDELRTLVEKVTQQAK